MDRTRPNQAKKLTPLHYEMAARAAMWNESRSLDRVATPRAAQRKITLASLELVAAHEPNFQVFEDLLVLYQEPATEAIEGVEPDNMVVLHPEAFGQLESFNVPLMPARPFWVMQYVTGSRKKKDHDEDFQKYERDLKVPYYLIFSPDKGNLTLYRLDETSQLYDTVLPDEHGRSAVREVGIEVGLVDGWARFWFEGRLLLLPAELDRELSKARSELDRERRRADDAVVRADRLAAKLYAMGIDPDA